MTGTLQLFQLWDLRKKAPTLNENSDMSHVMRKPAFCICETLRERLRTHKFSQKTSVFTLIIISSP